MYACMHACMYVCLYVYIYIAMFVYQMVFMGDRTIVGFINNKQYQPAIQCWCSPPYRGFDGAVANPIHVDPHRNMCKYVLRETHIVYIYIYMRVVMHNIEWYNYMFVIDKSLFIHMFCLLYAEMVPHYCWILCAYHYVIYIYTYMCINYM
jgi:hypothetical protein